MSFGFRSGSTPMRTDTRWVRWAKILTFYQSQPGADARNDLRQTDTLRMLKAKVLAAIEGSSFCWCPDGPVVEVCINILPAEASYDNFPPNEYDVTVLSPNTNYKLIAGANEASYQNEGGADTPLTDGEVVLFTSGPTPTFSLFGVTGNTPVTATICEV